MFAKSFIVFVLTVLNIGFAAKAVAASNGDVAAPLQERMSYATFRKLGLDHLSDAQLKGLNDWLRSHGDCGRSLASVETEHSSAARSKSPKSRDASSYKSRIAGDFSGWDQDMILALQDGLRWRVTDDEPMHVATLHNPKVTVWKGFFNTWLLSVEGLDTTVHVVPAN